MKPIKKRWLGLVIAPALLALIGFASPANATSYTSCASVPTTVNGDADITNTGACNLPSAVTATGFIHINSTGAITAQALSAGTDLNITTSSGAITTLGLTTSNGNLKVNSATNITVTGTIDSSISIQANANNGKIAVSGNVTSNLGGNGGNIFLVATGNVRTGSISTNGGTTTGGVEIHANTNANGALFNIGTATTNGVNGTINTSNSTAGGMIPDFVMGGIFITNGNANSTAGIKVISAANINVTASASRSGLIYLDARKGTLTLPTGALSSTGPAGQPAGQIVLMAGTLKAVNNTVITASQTAAALSTNHGVIVAASSITVAGAGGLKINGDGNGITGSFPTAYAQVIPTGGISVDSAAFNSNNVDDMLWTPSSITSSTNAPVTVSGTGAFTLTSNGNYARAAVYAYPITFSNAAVTISSKGTTNHQVELVYSGAMTGSNGLTMSGTGAVTLDASGSAGNDPGGTVYVLVDQATSNATVPSLTIKADGKGTGTGGNVTFQPTKVVSLAAPTVNMSANNGKSTSGAGVVNFQPNGGNGTAAITSTTFNLTANGPTAGNGDAGTVYFSTSALTQGSTTKSIFSAKGAAAGTGKGGFITVFPGAIADYKLGTNPGNVQVIADGGLTGGDAGRINVNPFPGSLTIDTANAVSAKALGGNAKGGFIQLVGNPNLSVNPTANGATINVDGKGTSSAGEIHIFANGTLDLGTTAGSLLLSAKGDPAGTGDGGIIELGYITDLTTSDISVAGGAGAGSNAKGGTINIHDSSTITVGTSNFDASAQGTGDGGSITINTASTKVDISQATINAKADVNGTGKGGQVVVANASGASLAVGLNVNKVIKVTGGDTVPVGNSSGVITLNTVRCEQWRTGFAGNAYPKTFWNCIDADRATAAPIADAAFTIEPGLKSLLATTQTADNPTVEIYAMPIINSYQNFFGRTISNNVGDYGISNLPYRVSISFASVYNQAGAPVTSVAYSGSPTIMKGTIVHELGHQLDYLWGDLSIQAAFTNLRGPDYSDANSFMNIDPGTGLARPCATVFDPTSPFCPGVGSNSDIFQLQYPVLTGATRDYELFAFVFEHIKSTQPGSGYQVDPWLEAPLRFVPGMTAYIQGLINNPPGAVR